MDHTDNEHQPDPIEVRFGFLLQLLGALGFAILSVGIVLSIAQDGALPTSTVSLANLPAGLIDASPAAILTLGLLCFLAAPVTGLVWLAIGYRATGDPFYSRITIGVLVVIALSIVVALVTRGG